MAGHECNSTLTVVVPTFQRAALLEGFIDAAVVAQDRYLEAQGSTALQFWILVNGPVAGYPVIERERRKLDWLEWTYLEKPGLSRTKNFALNNCPSKFIAFVDDDARLSPDWLIVATSLINRFPATAAFGGPVLAELRGIDVPRWFSPEGASIGIREESGPAKWVPGGNMILSVRAGVAAGGFSEALGMNGKTRAWGEEVDLCRRIRDRGGRIHHERELLVSHVVKSQLLSRRGVVAEAFRSGRQMHNVFPDRHPAGLRHARGHVIQAAQLMLKGFFSSSPQSRMSLVAQASTAMGRAASAIGRTRWVSTRPKVDTKTEGQRWQGASDNG